MNFESMSLEQLQAKLKKLSKATKEMGPMLFHLREKMRKQGVKGQGWSHWVKANLPITVRTADTWASEWAYANGKMKRTSRKISKGKIANVYTFAVRVPRPEWLNKTKEKELANAIEVVGDLRAFQIFFEAVTKAANGKALSAHA
jgi:hypothetical protein